MKVDCYVDFRYHLYHKTISIMIKDKFNFHRLEITMTHLNKILRPQVASVYGT